MDRPARAAVLLAFALALCAASGAAVAQPAPSRSTGLGKYFGDFTGCLVLYDVKHKEYTRVNPELCAQRRSPCSTFKIYNALVGLDTGVLKDENTTFAWDGEKRWNDAWNRDLTLAEAIKVSAVWYFQRVAREIGEERMSHYINDVYPYGNREIQGGIDRFWLSDTLAISAEEQVEFLRALYSGQLDGKFKPESIATVKKILVLSDENGAVFSGKTGSGGKDGEGTLGWFVGHVKGPAGEFVFALRIEDKDRANGPKAKEIMLSILKGRKLLP